MGGHIDSWDVGAGAQDDGSGIMAALEAAVVIKKLGTASAAHAARGLLDQ
jgi:Zn-dependent M28 family amino/carboxypeptidase